MEQRPLDIPGSEADSYSDVGLDGNPHRVRGRKGLIDRSRAALRRFIQKKDKPIRAVQRKLFGGNDDGGTNDKA